MTKSCREVFASRTAKLVLRERLEAQTPHRHRPVELIIALDKPVTILCGNGRVEQSNFFVVPPMCRHALQQHTGRVARIYLDIGYRRLTAWKGQTVRGDFGKQDCLRADVRHFFESARCADEAGRLIDRWLDAWLDEAQVGAPCDPRVAAVLAYLDSQDAPLQADRRLLADRVALSPTRLAAIFAADTGMPLSSYLIWRRVKIALAQICEGKSITYAAADAGFADGAHFTRCCRATYGVRPSSIAGSAVVPVTHAAFGKPAILGQHPCLTPHDYPFAPGRS